MTTLRVECTDYQGDSGVKVINVQDYGWWEVTTLGSSEYLCVYDQDSHSHPQDMAYQPVSVFPIVNVFGWWDVRPI